MQEQRTEIIDLTARLKDRRRAFARRLWRDTMHIRRSLPEIPSFRRVAAALVDADDEGLIMLISPELDAVDVKLVAYGFARRFTRFDGVDVIDRSTLREARAKLNEAVHPERVLERMVGP